jgi:hypothetical protein
MKKMYAIALAASIFMPQGCSHDVPSQEYLDWYVARKGYTAENITSIKNFISCNGGGYLAPDIKYDRETAFEVMMFQENENLKDKEGLVGKKTLEAMIRKCSENNCDSSICEGLKRIKE